MIRFTLIVLGLWGLVFFVYIWLMHSVSRGMKRINHLHLMKTGMPLFGRKNMETEAGEQSNLTTTYDGFLEKKFDDEELEALSREVKNSMKSSAYGFMVFFMVTLVAILAILIKGILWLL